ncbi:hypothetical protein Sinac_1655 [Singulisphaera acidiphila DSM 18658]|uniref:Uncharacterized protein n=2 Tax=Singulisphaera acidiphila TaxID=466153 RepID=L0DB16_SINAD|nr:hypothetical protein Sinac_1655 [Singulisphaera acidiphila DSM 18658]
MVVYRTRRCNGQPSDMVPAIYKKVVTLEESGWTGAGNGVQGFDGTKVLHDTVIALFDVGGTPPTNQAALDALAVQLAADHYNWLSVSFDEAFPEIIAPVVDGLTDLIVFSYQIDQVSTRRLSAPYNAQPEEFCHHDLANSSCKDNLTATPTPIITQKDPGTFEHYGPLATSSSGNLILPVFLSKLQGGLLVQKYSRTDTLACGCTCNWTFVVRDSCSGALLPGSRVSVSQGGIEIAHCTTIGQIASVTRGATGSNFTSVPTVTIAGSGSGATAIADMQLGSLARTSGGSGYNNGTFTGTFTGGGPGSGATFTFTVSGGVVQPPLAIVTQGSGYTSLPTPDFSAAGPGSGAAATVRLNVRALVLMESGTGYLSAIVGITGGGGTGATGTATVAARCTLDVPSGTYDVTVTPPEDLGYTAYSGSLSHACGQTTTIAIDVDNDHICTGTCGYGCRILPKTAYLTWTTDDGFDQVDFMGNPIFRVKYPSATLTVGPPFPQYGNNPAYYSEPFDLDVGPATPNGPHQHLTARYVISCLGPYVNWIYQNDDGSWSDRTNYAGGPGTSTSPGNVTCSPFRVVGGIGDSVSIGVPGRDWAYTRWTYSG